MGHLVHVMKVEMTEKLIGFDARVMWLPVDALWDTERKSVYLLREDVTLILSTDTGVWPSIFDDSTWGAEKSELKIDGPDLPDSMISSVYPLW